MPLAVKTPEIAGHKPAVDDGFAADRNFANAIGSRIHDAHFHPGQWLANRVRAKRFQIVDGDRRTGFRESVSVGDGNPEIVEKLQRLRFGESAADNNGAKFSAKRFMDLFEQEAADTTARLTLSEQLV